MKSKLLLAVATLLFFGARSARADFSTCLSGLRNAAANAGDERAEIGHAVHQR